MKTELYRKVIINNEADLPKDLDNYIVHTKDGRIFNNWFNHGLTYDWWFKNKNIDWYLLPVTEEEQREKLKKEILKFLDYADPIYWEENEWTDRRQLIDSYLNNPLKQKP